MYNFPALAKNKKIFFFIIVILALVIVLIGIQMYQWFCIPADVRQTVKDYYEYSVNSETQKALENVYFKEENKEHYSLILETDEKFEDYKIKKIRPINDDLYEVNMTVATTYFPKLNVTNYVMRKDGRWYFVINERDIDL